MREAEAMRIGISLSTTRSGDDHAAGAQSIIERAKAADRADLDSITLGDRHSTSTPYYQNVPMLGRVLAEISPARSVGCLFLLPLWHPVLAAEQIGTLATMSEQPFIIQTGIGSGQQQFEAMGRSLRTRAVDLEESIRVIGGLLAGETVSSDHFGIVDAQIAPLPPHGVEWWLGAGVDRALRRAALIGDAWYTIPSLTPAQLEQPMRRYEAFCDEAGRPARTAMRKDVLVLDDGVAADRAGEALLAAGYRGMRRDQVLIGSPDQVTEELAEFAALGVDDVIIRCMSADDAVAIETIESFGTIRRNLAD